MEEKLSEKVEFIDALKGQIEALKAAVRHAEARLHEKEPAIRKAVIARKSALSL